MTSVPPIVVVTRACRLDWNSPFFTDAEQRPIVMTVACAALDDRTRAAVVADVIVAGDSSVDLAHAVRELGARGNDNVLAEGGPGIAAQLAEADLLDELCLTISPLLAGGDAKRILDGGPLQPPARFELCHVLTDDGFLFLRYFRL